MAPKITKLAKAIPLAKLLAAAQVVMMAYRHWHRLEPDERRRLIALVRAGHGRPGNLTQRDRDELARLVAKADPRGFARWWRSASLPCRFRAASSAVSSALDSHVR